jgi:pilus assembly protein CpaF
MTVRVIPAEATASGVRDRLVAGSARPGGPGPSAVDVAAALRAEHPLWGGGAVRGRLPGLAAELAGCGPLQPLLDDPEVTDVLVNRPDEVWLDRGRGLERAGAAFPDDASVRRLAQRLAGQAGRRLDDASPYVDARLRDGVRLHAVLPPLSGAHTVLSLRVPARRPFTLAGLVQAGSAEQGLADWLAALVEARISFLVTGGTGTGKTTLLSSLLSLAPPDERILIVEDSAELTPDHPHVVRLEARPANVEGQGAVSVRDLVRQALRMRPDRLVVGEVRGAEVVDLLAALNTGHEGGCGTVHANGPDELPARLEALGIAAGLPRDAVHAQAAAGLQAVVHVDRASDGRRRVASVSVVTADGRGRLAIDPAAGPGATDQGSARLAALVRGRGLAPPRA